MGMYVCMDKDVQDTALPIVARKDNDTVTSEPLQ